MTLTVGATSYVIPAGLVENARHLAGRVADMEVVLFEVAGGPSNLPTAAEVRELAAIGRDSGLTYTVHLPADLPAQPRDALLHPDLAQTQRIIALTQPLDPYAYVFHMAGRTVRSPQTPPADLVRWQANAIHTLARVSSWVSDPSRLAVENVEGYAPDFLDALLAAVPVSRCADVGHLWVDGHDPLPWLQRWLPRTRVIHLHGLAERDHSSLQHMPLSQLAPVMDLLKEQNFTGVLTLEVFEADFEPSLAALGRWL